MSLIHNCRIELREVSLKATPTRLAVLKLLENSDTPLDVSSIRSYLIEKDIAADPATIFRMMNSFTNRGLTRQLEFNEGKFRYELTSRVDHHHLICEQCGSIEDISDCSIPALEEEIKKKKSFLVKRHSLEFFGLCQNCQR